MNYTRTIEDAALRIRFTVVGPEPITRERADAQYMTFLASKEGERERRGLPQRLRTQTWSELTMHLAI